MIILNDSFFYVLFWYNHYVNKYVLIKFLLEHIQIDMNIAII